MKIKTLFLALAATMLIFTACKKDEGVTDGNDTPADVLTENTLMVDGVKYQMEVTLLDGMGFQAVNVGGKQFVLNGGIQHIDMEGESVNITYDLTQPRAGLHCGFSFNGDDFFYLVYDNTGEKVMGQLEETEYDGSSMFSEGTATIRMQNNELYVKIDGKLKNGHTFGFIISAALSHNEEPQMAPNTIIIGDSRFEVESSLSISGEGNYLFGVSSANFDMIADVSATMMQKTADLSTLSGDNYYFITFRQTGLIFAQQVGEEPFAELNGNAVTAAFSEGSIRLFEANDAITLLISGTLENGTYFGAQISVPIADIQAMDYQVIQDGTAYSADVMATKIDGTYCFSFSGYDPQDVNHENGAIVTISVDFNENALNKTIDLTEANPSCTYVIRANGVTDLKFLQLVQSGQVKSCFDGDMNDATQGVVFTKGSIYIEYDNGYYSVSIIGTLSNGHSFSTQVRMYESEVQVYED